MFGDVADVGRFVALSAMRHRGQVRGVGLQHEASLGQGRRHGKYLRRILEGDHPAERHQAAEGKHVTGVPFRADEAVEDRANFLCMAAVVPKP